MTLERGEVTVTLVLRTRLIGTARDVSVSVEWIEGIIKRFVEE